MTSNIEDVPDQTLLLYKQFSETVNDLWSTIIRDTPDKNPVRNATSCLSVALVMACVRHPEWVQNLVSKIEEAFAIIDPQALTELQHNADVIVEYVTTEGWEEEHGV